MPKGLIFWIIMLLVLLFGLLRRSPAFAGYAWGWDWLLYLLLFILGWQVFGFMIT